MRILNSCVVLQDSIL